MTNKKKLDGWKKEEKRWLFDASVKIEGIYGRESPDRKNPHTFA